MLPNVSIAPSYIPNIHRTDDSILCKITIITHVVENLKIVCNRTCKSMVSCQKGPTHQAYAWQIGPFWQDTLHMYVEQHRNGWIEVFNTINLDCKVPSPDQEISFAKSWLLEITRLAQHHFWDAGWKESVALLFSCTKIIYPAKYGNELAISQIYNILKRKNRDCG